MLELTGFIDITAGYETHFVIYMVQILYLFYIFNYNNIKLIVRQYNKWVSERILSIIFRIYMILLFM